MPKISKVEKRLNRDIGRLIGEKDLIKEGDHLLVGLSGGKDSWTLTYFLREFQKKAPITFQISVVTLDVGFTPKEQSELASNVESLGLPFEIVGENLLEIVSEKRTPGSSACSLCARFRRAYLYNYASKVGANKVALGHHKDDFVETVMMNIFYHGKMKGMPAILNADNGVHQLIRPMLYCDEEMIRSFTSDADFPIIRCICCATIKKEVERPRMKALLKSLEEETPGLRSSIVTAAQNVYPEHMF